MTRIRQFCGLVITAMLAAESPALCQFGRFPFPGRSSYPGGRSGTGLPPAVPGGVKQSKKKKPEEPLGNFSGTLKGIGSKSLTLESEDSNTIQFNCTKKTRYYDGSKKIKASRLKAGDHVIVEAKKALDGSLDAVNVRLASSAGGSRPAASSTDPPKQ